MFPTTIRSGRAEGFGAAVVIDTVEPGGGDRPDRHRSGVRRHDCLVCRCCWGRVGVGEDDGPPAQADCDDDGDRHPEERLVVQQRDGTGCAHSRCGLTFGHGDPQPRPSNLRRLPFCHDSSSVGRAAVARSLPVPISACAPRPACRGLATLEPAEPSAQTALRRRYYRGPSPRPRLPTGICLITRQTASSSSTDMASDLYERCGIRISDRWGSASEGTVRSRGSNPTVRTSAARRSCSVPNAAGSPARFRADERFHLSEAYL